MKRCPECRRDYFDDTLLYCLDDGNALLEGPASVDEPATAILSEPGAVATGFRTGEAKTEIFRNTGGASTENPNSIAVLPFANMSADEENDYFCDGLAEELLNALSKIDELKVAARTSAFSFKGKNANVSEIGQMLSVKTVLEGSVRKSGDRVRITVQLINADDGYHLWSERYDREMRDIFDVQDEITLAVVDALKLKLFGDEKSVILKKGTENTEALELYLRGRALWSRRTHADFKKAIEYFEQAIALDPNYALAYSGLADCYSFLAYFEAFAPAEMAPKSKAAVEKAMELDDTLAESHASLAMYKTFFEFDIRAGESELRKAIELNPNSSTAHYWYCSVLAALGRFDEAIVEGKIALELDPLSPVVNASVCRALCCAGRYEKAIELSNKCFEILPDFFFAHWILGWAYSQTGRLDEAIEHYRKSSMAGGLIIYGYLGTTLVRAGMVDEARGLLDELDEQVKHRFVSPFAMAVIHAALGDMLKGLDLLEKAWEMRVIQFLWIEVDPVFDVFRQEPRFHTIRKQIGLPDYEL